MRWHVELRQTDTRLRTEHVETADLARETAAEFVAHSPRKAGLPEEAINTARADILSEDYEGVEPGLEWSYGLGNGELKVVIAALAEGTDDEDCWACKGEEG